MNAQQARKLTDDAHKRRDDENEARMQNGLNVVYGKVKEAAEKGHSEVEVRFNGTPKNKYPELFIGECGVIHWDGGEMTEVNENGREMVKRLKAEGYEAEICTIYLKVKW